MTFLAPVWAKTRRRAPSPPDNAAAPQLQPPPAEIEAAPVESWRDATRPGAARLDATWLYERHLDDVFRYVSRRLARREDAEDVCAETFAAAFEALPRFRGEVEPRLWLLGIARRKVADALRRQVARREVAFPPELDPPDSNRHVSPPRALIREESYRQMLRVLNGLKDEQREALWLKYVEELSIQEIAVVMNRSKAAANSLLQRARAAAFRGGRDYFLDFETAPDHAPNEVKP